VFSVLSSEGTVTCRQKQTCVIRDLQDINTDKLKNIQSNIVIILSVFCNISLLADLRLLSLSHVTTNVRPPVPPFSEENVRCLKTRLLIASAFSLSA
jgi:hypothetical protein